MNIKIDKYAMNARHSAKALIFSFISLVIIILLYEFIVDGIDWLGFIEFIISCLLLIFLVEKINIKVPGLLEIKTELSEIKRSLSVVAQNISNIKNVNKTTIVTPTYYEGAPVDLIDSMLSTGTVNTLTQEAIDTEENEEEL